MTMRSSALGVASVLFGAGCQADDEGGFRITNVEFDGDSITLTFSEPLAPLEGIDPNDFRLSHAMTSSYTYTYAGMSITYEYTSYEDLAFILGSYDYYYNAVRFMLMEVVQGPAANQIVLRTGESLTPVCDEINEDLESFEMYGQMYSPGSRFDTALFLHYASGNVPIESEAGGMLGDIGADWVRSDELDIGREGFGFTQLAPQLRIPCP